MATKREPGTVRPVGSKRPRNKLAEFVNELLAIDETAPCAALNATSIAGGKHGDRILL